MYLGRQVIYTAKSEITKENIIDILVKASGTHELNVVDINYLYSYYKGQQPIIERTKTINTYINNKIIENRAYEIVDFKVGYLCGEPIQYVARKSDKTDSVVELNNLLSIEFKSANDKEIIFWQNVCGTGYRMVLPDNEKDENECPFTLYALDPTDAFVVYRNDYTKKPIMGVYITVDELNNKYYNCYTENKFYVVKNLLEIIEIADNTLGLIPIVEYPSNEARMGAFEPVLSLLDAKNTIASNRVDGIEQFIQALMVAVNVDFPEGTTAEDIKKAGMLVLKTIGDGAHPDIKILSEQLNQTETQTLVDYLDFLIDKIVGMPSTSNGNTSDSSNNGAVILKNGWQGAEARAKESEIIFKKSEQKALKIMLKILESNGLLTDLSIIDIDYRFTRRCYEDINSKANVLNLLLSNDKVNPKDAYNVCGLFSDSEVAYKNGMAWYNELSDKANEKVESEIETEIIETPNVEVDNADSQE